MTNPELIDRYFEGSLTDEERKKFEELLEVDPDFKEEFLFQKDLKAVIEDNKRKELKTYLQEVEGKMSNKIVLPFIKREWLVAASLALTLAIGTWGVKNSFYPSNERIYNTYYDPYINTVQPITRGSNTLSIEYRAFVAYESGDFHKAINLFSSVKNPDRSYILFYKAMCYMSLDKLDEAMPILENIIAKNGKSANDLEWSNKANWYMALCHIKKDQDEQALFYLNRLLEYSKYEFKAQEAQRIIGFLD